MNTPLLCDDSRENNLDALRFAFATLVLVSHSYLLTLGGNDTEPLMIATRGQLTGGSLAVDAFFTISGFLIARSWLRSRGLLDFLRRRSLRIGPGFAVAMLFGLAVVRPLAVIDAPGGLEWLRDAGFARALLHFPLPKLPPVFETNPYPHAVNGSLWTIRYEFLCYLALAALGLAGILKRRSLVLGLFVGVCLWMLVYELYFQAHTFFHREIVFDRRIPYVGTPSSWARFLTYFLAGTVAYLYRDAIPRSRPFFAFSLAALFATSQLPPFLHASLPICGVYVLLYTGFERGLGLEGFGRRGDLSYGIYLYAFPVQQLLVERSGPGLRPLVLAAAALPITLILALASWHLVEGPALRLKWVSIPWRRPRIAIRPYPRVAQSRRDVRRLGEVEA